MLFLLQIVLCKIFALAIGVYLFRLLPIPYKLILAQVAIAFTCEITGYFLSFGKTPNGWVFNFFYLPAEIWLTGTAAFFLCKRKGLKTTIPFLLLIATLCLAISMYFNGINNLSHWGILSIGIVLIIVYLNILVDSALSSTATFKQPAFWISLSVIVYFSCIIPYFGLYKYLINYSPGLLRKLFNINSIMFLIVCGICWFV
jgi:hypothetical protein